MIDIVGKICQDTVKINPGWSFLYDSHKHPVWLRMDITRGNLGLIASEQNHTSPPLFSCKGIVKDSYLSPVKGVQRRSNNRPSCSFLFLIPTVSIYNSLTSPFLREETWIHLYSLFNSIQFIALTKETLLNRVPWVFSDFVGSLRVPICAILKCYNSILTSQYHHAQRVLYSSS